MIIPAADTPDQARDYAEKATAYGLPLLLMEQTRQSSQSNLRDRAGITPQANTFFHARQLVSSRGRVVIRPNNDTLYSTAWLDLSKGPVRLDVPVIRDRYWIMPLMDAWTNVFATVGSRTHAAMVSKEATSWWIVTSAQRDQVPAGAQLIESPTDMVWIIGRIELRGAGDLATVRAVQDGFTLSPALPAENLPANAVRELPPRIVSQLPATEFFERLAQLMARQKPLPQDDLALAVLRGLGVTAGKPFPARSEPASAAWLAAVEEGKKNAFDKLANAGFTRRAPEAVGASNGWNMNNSPDIGRFGSNYALRAGIAMAGLGALPLADAWYPSTELDGNLQPLHGARKYQLHFDAKQLPPAQAFWSLTLYDQSGYFVDNPLNRYALTDRDALRFNDDGSLDLYIGGIAPADSKWQANWLPAPDAAFNLSLRIYDPTAPAIAGKWLPPPITRSP